MVTDGRSSMHLQKASQLSNQWGPPQSFLLEEKSEDFALEELGQEAILELSEMMKPPLKVFTSLCYQEVDMRVKLLLSSYLAITLNPAFT